jgi:hypothetical protein
MLPVRTDLAQLFLDLAARNNVRLFWGTYDPGDWATDGRHALAVNRDFMDEVKHRYGDHPAFAGWYLSFELCRDRPEQVELLVDVGRHAKDLTPSLPTLISPFIAGPKAPGGGGISREQHEADWHAIFQRLRECVDIVAFQDGHVDYVDLPDYLAANARMAGEAGIECWSNVETFDRDTPLKFPPIDWRKLEFKLEAARHAGVQKLITFEFSHFMSPHADAPSARALFRRYCERFGLDPGTPAGDRLDPA